MAIQARVLEVVVVLEVRLTRSVPAPLRKGFGGNQSPDLERLKVVTVVASPSDDRRQAKPLCACLETKDALSLTSAAGNQ